MSRKGSVSLQHRRSVHRPTGPSGTRAFGDSFQPRAATEPAGQATATSSLWAYYPAPLPGLTNVKERISQSQQHR